MGKTLVQLTENLKQANELLQKKFPNEDFSIVLGTNARGVWYLGEFFEATTKSLNNGRTTKLGSASISELNELSELILEKSKKLVENKEIVEFSAQVLRSVIDEDVLDFCEKISKMAQIKANLRAVEKVLYKKFPDYTFVYDITLDVHHKNWILIDAFLSPGNEPDNGTRTTILGEKIRPSKLRELSELMLEKSKKISDIEMVIGAEDVLTKVVDEDVLEFCSKLGETK